MSANGLERKRSVYIGHDPRQPLAYNVMRYSVESHASAPVAVSGLFLHQLPISRVGATEFTYSRFLVPWLMDFKGIGLFFDEDQVMEGDVWELFAYCSKLGDWDIAVMQDQPRFEWSSAIAFNCAKLTHVTPEFIEDPANGMFDLEWAKKIESLPKEWNHGCGMTEPKAAKLYHWSQGIPYWKETRGLEEDPIWFQAFESMVKSGEWMDFHHNTIHFQPVMRRFLRRYGLNLGEGDDEYQERKRA